MGIHQAFGASSVLIPRVFACAQYADGLEQPWVGRWMSMGIRGGDVRGVWILVRQTQRALESIHLQLPH